MPPARNLRTWWAAALLSLAAFLLLLLAALPGGAATPLDVAIARWFVEHRTPAATRLGLIVADATSPALIVAIACLGCLVLYSRRHRLAATTLATATVLAYVVGAALKYTVNRPRPTSPVNLAPEAEPSFPSGHVLVMSAVVLTLVALVWRRISRTRRRVAAAAAAAVILVVALDRLVVGAHWFTDVLGSIALGALVLCVVSLTPSGRAVTSGQASS